MILTVDDNYDDESDTNVDSITLETAMDQPLGIMTTDHALGLITGT